MTSWGGAHRNTAILWTLCLVQFVNAADVTVLNVALPVLRDDLDFKPADLSWVINGYLIAMTASLLVAGRMCDAWGNRRVFTLGVALFTASAIACGLAPNALSLVLARVGQGIGGSLATAAELALIVALYPSAAQRAKAFATLSVAGIIGSSIGLVGGGAVVEWLSWRWVFAADVLIGIATFVIALRLIPADRPAGGRIPVRVGSATLAAVGLAALATAIVRIDGSRPTATLWVFAALGLASLTAFFVAQQRMADPLLPLAILTDRAVMVGGTILAICTAVMLGQFYVQTQYLQIVLNYDSWTTGLAFLPVNLGVGGMSFLFASRLVSRFGARRVLGFTMVTMTAGLVLYAIQPLSDASYVAHVLPAMIVTGLAGGIATVAGTVAALDSAKAGNAGVTSGLVKVMQQGGGVIGIAVLASTIATVSASGVTPEGLRAAMIVGAALAAVGAAITPTLPGPPPPPTLPRFRR